jgi:DNA-binding response OmpR family regulator
MMRGETILVVEDDPAILTGLLDLLENEGYNVFSATDGKTCLDIYKKENPALILLDIMIPQISGYDVCREIRKRNTITPILMLTAKGQEVDKVLGLELGADDYIVKPFGVSELLARIRAALRRIHNRDTGQDHEEELAPIEFGDVQVDPRTMIGTKGARQFSVTKRELRLLQFFCSREGTVLSRETLLTEIWGLYYDGTTRTLDQHIAKLRRKIENNPAEPRYITTVHGIGYRFKAQS